MSVDLIEIALEKLTDATEFERLAGELMYLEGYTDIKLLGGQSDFGQDAVQDRLFFREGRNKTVFQFTLQENVSTKVQETINKLEKNHIQYSQLVLVTSRRIATEKQLRLIQKIQKEYDVELHIYERNTIIIRLSDYSNGLFERHFPSIEAQVRALKSSSSRNVPLDDAIEEGLLRASLAFVFCDRASSTRKALFDILILESLANREIRNYTIVEICSIINSILPSFPTDAQQVRAALERLIPQGKIENVGGGAYIITHEGKISVIGAIVKAEQYSGLLISEIVSKVSVTLKDSLSHEDEQKLEKNCYNLLVFLFRLFGIELSGQLLGKKPIGPIFSTEAPKLKKIASQGVSDSIGKLLLGALANTIQSPTEEQAKALASWARAFIGSSILSIDPMLRKLHKIQFSKRIFVLDTDVLLDIIVKDGPRSLGLRSLVESILRQGSRVIAPIEVMEECARHAQYSIHTYRYFGMALFGMEEFLIEQRVHNAFVAGFAYARMGGRIGKETSFSKYLSDYYEESNPLTYLISVAKHALPGGVEFLHTKTLLEQDMDNTLFEHLNTELQRSAQFSRKAQYRTSDETDSLARTDAILATIAIQLPNSELAVGTDAFLPRRCYVITNSSRYLRACQKLSINESISARPQQLMSILELITDSALTDMEYVRFFENPFLIAAVENIWDGAKILLEDGISLLGKSLPRLQWDFSQSLHLYISEVEKTMSEKQDEMSIDNLDEKEAELMMGAAKLGYKLNPAFEIVQKALDIMNVEKDSLKKELEELSDKHEELKKEIDRFGRRRQRYLRKIADGKNTN